MKGIGQVILGPVPRLFQVRLDVIEVPNVAGNCQVHGMQLLHEQTNFGYHNALSCGWYFQQNF